MDVIYVLIKEKKGATYTEIKPWFGWRAVEMEPQRGGGSKQKNSGREHSRRLLPAGQKQKLDPFTDGDIARKMEHKSTSSRDDLARLLRNCRGTFGLCFCLPARAGLLVRSNLDPTT